MAQLVVAAAGAALGSMLGPGALFLGMTGSQLGWIGGSLLGSMMSSPPSQQGPRLDDSALRVTGTEYGQAIPWIAGAPRLPGLVIWASDRHETASTEEVGKGGGQEFTSYTYQVDLLVLLADVPGCSVTRIWLNGKTIWTSLDIADDASRIASEAADQWTRLTVYDGSTTQLPDPTYEAAVTDAPAYRGRTTVFIEGLQLGNSGAIPQLTYEVATSVSESDQIVRRYNVADTGVRLSDNGGTRDGHGLIRRMTPTIALEFVTGSLNKTGFLIDGTPDVWPSAFTPVAFGAQPYDSYPIGSIDSTPVRMQANSVATGGAYIILPIGVTTNIIHTGVPALEAGIPNGKYITGCYMCSDGSHALITHNGTASTAAPTDYHLVRRVSGTLTTVRTGTVSGAFSLNSFGHGGMGEHEVGMLEDDLLHLWATRGAGTGEVVMYGINPDTNVLSQRGILESGAGLPSYSFTYPTCWAEAGYCVVFSGTTYSAFRRAGDTINPVTLQSVVEALCARAGMPAGTYDATALASITKPVRALAIGQVSSTRGTLEVLQTSHFFDCVLSDKLYFAPRDASPAATIAWDDLGAGIDQAADEPFALTIGNDLELPAQIAIQYRNMAADQQTGTAYSDRHLSGQASTQTMQLALGLTPAEAKGVADAISLDSQASLLTSNVATTLAYAKLQATTLLQVTAADGTLYRMRVTKRQDDGNLLTLDLVADDAQALVSAEITDSDYTPQTSVSPLADTVVAPLDVPIFRDADNAGGYYVAVKGDTGRWPSAALFVSLDNVTYTSATTIGSQAVIGEADTLLPDWTGGPVFDERSTLDVDVGAATLSSATREALLSDPALNLMIVGSEVIRYATATLLGASPTNTYRLSRLLRGQRGTEWATGTHAIGDRVVGVGINGWRRISQPATERNRAAYLKGVTAGRTVASTTAQTITNTDRGLKPFAPVGLRASRDAAGGYSFSWWRRTRLAATLVGPSGINAPLGEASEAYEIDIVDSGTVVRTLTASQPSCTYSAAQQLEDFGQIPASVDVRVYQMSAAVGRGYALQAAATTPYVPVAQVSTITVGGTYASGKVIDVYVDNALLVSYTTTVGDTNLNGIATSLAAAIDAAPNFTASAVGAVVSVTGRVGVLYTLDARVQGASSAQWDLQQAASAYTQGSPYQARVYIANRISGATEPVVSGTTLTLRVERPVGQIVASASYTTTEDASRYTALSGLSSAFAAQSALAAAGYTFGLASDAWGYYGNVTGPFGVEGVHLAESGTNGFGLAISISAPGQAQTAAQAQSVDFTLTGTAVVGEQFTVIIDGTSYSHTISGAETTADAAAAIAALIDAEANYTATVPSGAIVRVTHITVNTPFTYSTRVTRPLTMTVA